MAAFGRNRRNAGAFAAAQARIPRAQQPRGALSPGTPAAPAPAPMAPAAPQGGTFGPQMQAAATPTPPPAPMAPQAPTAPTAPAAPGGSSPQGPPMSGVLGGIGGGADPLPGVTPMPAPPAPPRRNATADDPQPPRSIGLPTQPYPSGNNSGFVNPTAPVQGFGDAAPLGGWGNQEGGQPPAPQPQQPQPSMGPQMQAPPAPTSMAVHPAPGQNFVEPPPPPPPPAPQAGGFLRSPLNSINRNLGGAAWRRANAAPFQQPPAPAPAPAPAPPPPPAAAPPLAPGQHQPPATPILSPEQVHQNQVRADQRAADAEHVADAAANQQRIAENTPAPGEFGNIPFENERFTGSPDFGPGSLLTDQTEGVGVVDDPAFRFAGRAFVPEDALVLGDILDPIERNTLQTGAGPIGQETINAFDRVQETNLGILPNLDEAMDTGFEQTGNMQTTGDFGNLDEGLTQRGGGGSTQVGHTTRAFDPAEFRATTDQQTDGLVTNRNQSDLTDAAARAFSPDTTAAQRDINDQTNTTLRNQTTNPFETTDEWRTESTRTQMDPIIAAETRRFNRETIPGLAERFSGMGLGHGSDFGNSMAQASADLSTSLGSQQAQFDDLFNERQGQFDEASNLRMAGQAEAANMRRFEGAESANRDQGVFDEQAEARLFEGRESAARAQAEFDEQNIARNAAQIEAANRDQGILDDTNLTRNVGIQETQNTEQARLQDEANARVFESGEQQRRTQAELDEASMGRQFEGQENLFREQADINAAEARQQAEMDEQFASENAAFEEAARVDRNANIEAENARQAGFAETGTQNRFNAAEQASERRLTSMLESAGITQDVANLPTGVAQQLLELGAGLFEDERMTTEAAQALSSFISIFSMQMPSTGASSVSKGVSSQGGVG